MNEENTRKLFKRFKFLKKTALKSIEIGDGWYGLMYDMCKELKSVNPPDDFVITLVTEKCGGLNVHSKNGAMRTRVIIDEFNTASLETCDGCGNDRDLEQCDKCIIPVVEYPDPEEDDEDSGTGQCDSSCAPSCSPPSGGT